MDYDEDTVDDAVVALLYLAMFEDHGITRAWKSHDWDTLDRLYQKGSIHNPKGKAKSVVVTDTGRKRAKELFEKLFSKHA